MIYLYLKTHNVTGLKYLGKTEQDPYQYSGSGVWWKAHLKKHGHDVTTEVLFKTEDKAEFKEVALEYSNKWNIVESADFANLMLEEGQGGVNSGSWKKGNVPWIKGRTDIKLGPQSPEHIRKRTENQKKSVTIDGIKYDSMKEASAATGISKPTIKAWADTDGWDSIDTTKDRRILAREKVTKLNKQKHTCPHCGAEANIGNLKRWHNEKCKYKP